ncbi:MAG: 16S rRNA (cytosine(1402)-N(4))-methyltransferase RsmH [Acidobacteriaceae bacterium]
MSKPQHVPVLLDEAMEYLNVRPGTAAAPRVYVDATLGLAGHSMAIAKRLGAQDKLICFDRDTEAMAQAKQALDELAAERGSEMPEVVYHAAAFSKAAELLEPGSVDGLLADFGVSSLQLGAAHRGFSFQADGPLDMRMDTRPGIGSGPTAEQVVNQMDETDLANLIYEFGEERRSRRIARAIVRARPITTTVQLARVVSAAAPQMKHKGKGHSIHPATRTFQALRIRVNDELGEIEALLRIAPGLLKPQGRLVLISFHSLEDRLVKDAFKAGAKDGIYEVLTRKPVIAQEQESMRNPRSRSAKLRAAEKQEPEKQGTGMREQGTAGKSGRRKDRS